MRWAMQGSLPEGQPSSHAEVLARLWKPAGLHLRIHQEDIQLKRIDDGLGPIRGICAGKRAERFAEITLCGVQQLRPSGHPAFRDAGGGSKRFWVVVRSDIQAATMYSRSDDSRHL